MGREILQGHLLKADEFVGAGERCIVRQRVLIEELKRDGHSVAAAQGLLKVMLVSLALHKERQQSLRAELGLAEEEIQSAWTLRRVCAEAKLRTEAPAT